MIGNISILVVEDELAIAEALSYRLELEGYQVTHVTTCQEALEKLHATEYQFTILDVTLPDGTGFELCKTIRTFSSIPILFLTARSDEIDRVVGLEIGADDYMSKPFSPRELVARLKATLKRVHSPPPGPVPITAPRPSLLQVDAERYEISFHGVIVPLTHAEYKLLTTLIGQAGRVFTREQLMMEISTDPGAALDRVIDAHIKSIRSKLKAISPNGAELIETRRGVGYAYKSTPSV